MVKLNEEKKSLVSYDREITTLENDCKKKTKEVEESSLESQQLSIELKTNDQLVKQYQDRFKKMITDNSWVEDQRLLFGVAGGKYDFSGLNIEESKKRVHYLKTQYEKHSKSVDKSALEKYDRVEKKESLLKQRLQTVKKDKTQIHSTLEYLDRKKLAKLNDTFDKVNRYIVSYYSDFGLIFGELLPGNTCKLVHVEGDDISKGLEVKVCLGGVWKASLTELSGGQRSLIALSLILALLQFNPAPMYILDEIDAALDLSHTQNIGKLLKSRFKTSQFIIVSLKDGMFNNANVLFRTRFSDGISMVERQTSSK